MLPAPDLSSLKLTSLEPDKTGVEMGLAVSMLARWSRYKVWFESELSDQVNARPPYPSSSQNIATEN